MPYPNISDDYVDVWADGVVDGDDLELYVDDDDYYVDDDLESFKRVESLGSAWGLNDDELLNDDDLTLAAWEDGPLDA